MPGDFSRPTGGRQKLVKKPAAKPKVVRRTTAPVTDAQSSGPDYGTRKANKFKQTKQFGAAISAAAVQGVKDDQAAQAARARAAASAAKAWRPFNVEDVKTAIRLKLPEADHLWIDKNGHIQRHNKATLLPFGIGDSAVADSDTVLDPKHGGNPRAVYGDTANGGVAKSGLDAAGQKLIDQTLRPSRAIMGTIDELAQGHGLKGAVHGFTEGLIKNHPYSAGKILKRAGVPKEIAGPVGFVADVAADPTTYATFGAGSIARKAGEDAAAQTAKRAAKAGMTEAGVRTVAKRAGEKAAATASVGTGLTVKFAGKEVPAVRRVTAKTGSGVSKVAAKAPVRVKAVAGGAKKLVSDVRPQLKQAGVSEGEHLAVRRTGARARAEGAQGMAEATRRARAVKKLIPADQYAAVIDAIERGKIKSLPAELQKPAVELRDSLRYMKRLRKRSGVGAGEIGGTTTKLGPVPTKYQTLKKTGEQTYSQSVEERLLAHPELRDKWNRYITLHNQDTNVGHALDEAKKLEPALAPILHGDGLTVGHYALVTGPGTKRGRLTRTTTKTRNASGEGAARSYFPHALADELKDGHGVHEAPPMVKSKGVRKVSLGSEQKRTDLRPISVQNTERLAAGETPFSAHLPLVYGNYMADTSRAVAAKNLAAGLHAAGRPFKDGMALHPDDVVFHYHNGDLTPLKTMPESVKAEAGQYVVLNRTTVEREFANIAPQLDRTHVGAFFDKGTSVFKRVATFTPGFHARNLVGDTAMGYLAVPGQKIPGNLRAAGRAVRRMGGIEKAQERTLGAIPKDTRTIKLRRTPKDHIKVAGKPMHVDSFIGEAKKHGVVRSGFIGRELREQGHGVGTGFKRVGSKLGTVPRTLNRWMQNREDWVRLATFKHGLDKGMTPEQAADLSRNMHIDYGDLTKFERTVARRAMPFYTFSARGLPIHAKALVQRPGKFAQVGKLQQEAALATGADFQKDRKKLKTSQARQIPLILNIGGQPKVISDSLPMVLLNELPAGASPGKYINEIAQWLGQLANPILKDPVELYANRSFFFRNDIQPKDYPLVAAPSWVKAIHDASPGLAASLGITPDYIDRKTGKKTWGWYGKADYVFKSIPGIPLFAQKLTQDGNRRGQSQAEQVLGFVAGVRSEPLDPQTALTEVLFQEHDDLGKQIGALRQRAHTAANAREASLLLARQRAVERQIYKLSRKRGDAIPLYRPSGGGSGPSLGGGLSGGLSSGLGG